MAGIFDNDPTEHDVRIPGWGAFETSVLRSEIEPFFPQETHVFRLRETFTIHGKQICPDIAVFVEGASLDCVCVVDAKDRAQLEKRDVEKVVLYKELLDADRAMLFVRAGCDVRQSAIELARVQGVELEPHAPVP